MADITYTPNGVPRAPGFINPDNPYDTGRPGEKNTELNGGVGGTPDGWNRDTQTWDGTINNPSGGGGGSNPFGNPYYQQYEAAQKAQQAADLADTKAQLQQLLIQFGLIPGNFQDKYGALDDTIRKLIEQNTQSGISQYARMIEGKQDVQRETIGRLGGRGLLRSGSKGYRLRRDQLGFDRTFADALNAVLGNANQIQTGYANREYGRQMSLSQMLASIMSSYRPGGGGGGAYRPNYQSPPPAPAFNLQQAQNYWQGDPAPTYTSPTSGQQWYGGFGGLESTPFKGKALDSLF